MKKKIVLCPKFLNIYDSDDYEKCLKFISEIESTSENEELIISFAYCRELKAAAHVVLFAKIEMLLKNKNIKIKVRPSNKSKIVNLILKESGLLDLCEKNQINYKFANLFA